MEGLRGQLRAEAISDGAINLILASWREKTNATYNSAWRKWERWCTAHTTDPFSASIANVLEFLGRKESTGLSIVIDRQYLQPICQFRVSQWVSTPLCADC